MDYIEENIKFLTNEEKSIVDMMRKGESISGKEITQKAIINWIELCLSNKILMN